MQLDDFVTEAARTFPGIERIRREWEDVLGYLLEQDALNDLEHDVEEIRWTPQGGGDVAHEFCLFSRSGFNRSLTEAAEERDDLRLFSIEDIVTAF